MAAAGSALRLAERLAQRVGGLAEAQTEELGRALVDCGLGEPALEAAQARLAPPSVPASAAGAAQVVQELIPLQVEQEPMSSRLVLRAT